MTRNSRATANERIARRNREIDVSLGLELHQDQFGERSGKALMVVVVERAGNEGLRKRERTKSLLISAETSPDQGTSARIFH